MSRFASYRPLVAGLAIALLAGCATPRMTAIERGIDNSSEIAAQRQNDLANQGEGFFEEREENWFGDEAIPLVAEEAEPTAFASPMMFRRTYPVSLQMVGEYITTTFGIPVDISADAVVSATENAYDASAFLGSRNMGGMGGAAAQGLFTLQYEGTLKGFLEQVAARTGNSWRYSKGRIAVFNLETKTFMVHAIPGETIVDSTITNAGGTSNAGGSGGAGGGGGGGGGGGEGGGSGGGTSSSSTSMTSTFEVYETARTTIESMLSPKGKVAIAPSTGTISVTDVPGAIERISVYMDDLNARLLRQVAVDVRVYSVEIDDTDAYGINWDAVWQTLSSRYAISFGNGGPVPTNAGELAVTVVDDSSPFAGSAALVQALSQQGKLSVQTTASVVTLNNQPVPVQVAEQTNYVPSAQTTIVEGGIAQTTLTTATLTTGFSMNLLPVVLDKNEILMQLALNLSSLRDIRQIQAGDLRVEAPQVDSRQFLQRVRIGSGDMLVLSGFEQDRLRSDLRGLGSPKFTAAGGSRGTERRRSVLVVTLTPRIIG